MVFPSGGEQDSRLQPERQVLVQAEAEVAFALRLLDVAEGLRARGDVRVVATAADGAETTFMVTARIDTPEELVAFRHGGILPYVVRQLVTRS